MTEHICDEVEASDVQKTATQQDSGKIEERNRRGGWLARILHEPLLHFLLLGAVLFALANYFADSQNAPADDSIVVSEGKIRSLAQIFQRTWQRPPTQQELDGLIDDYVNEEVFYREALAMGLDRDDTVIRRRMRQKLEFVAEDLADTVEPTEEQLQQYLDAHADTYRLEDQTTFTQIFFSPQRRGESVQEDLMDALGKLRDGDVTVDPAELGDPTLLPTYQENTRDSAVAGLMGKQFSKGIKGVKVGVWSGPIESAYGIHLVKIDDRVPGRLPELDEVRDAVRRDWYAERRAESKQQFYDGLRQRYEVTIEMPTPEDSASDTNVPASGDQEAESP